MLDSKVDETTDAKKSGSDGARDWTTLEKFAQKASDDDLKKLTSTLSSDWFSIADLSKALSVPVTTTKTAVEKLAPATETVLPSAIVKGTEIVFNAIEKSNTPNNAPNTTPVESVKIDTISDGKRIATIGDKPGEPTAQVIANPDGSRDYIKDGKSMYRLHGANGGFTAGEFSSDGKRITQTRDGETLFTSDRNTTAQFFKSMNLITDATAQTVEEALENLKKGGTQLPKDKLSFIRLKTGVAVVHPDLDRDVEFKYSPDGIELHMDLGNGQSLLRSPKGKLYVVSADSSVKELTPTQKLELIRAMGPQAKLVRHILHSMESGEPIEFQDGQKISIKDGANELTAIAPNKPNESGEPQSNTVAVLSENGYTVDDPTRKVSFDDKTGELIVDTDGKKTTIDLDSPKFDMVTDDFVRKDGLVTFDDKTKIADDGNVELPDGTKINARNDIFFTDGSVLYRDGTLVSKDGTIVSTGMNLPQKTNLDSFVSQAISMATAAAGRVASGSFNPADLAVIEANMSVVQNFINLFSVAGNMQMANSLYRSWTILKASHERAQHEASSKNRDHAEMERDVREFLIKLKRSAA